jgi:hypothetical protein
MHRRLSLEGTLHIPVDSKFGRKTNVVYQTEPPDVRKGIRRLQRIIRLIENEPRKL